MIIFDIETSGTDPVKNSIVSIGAVDMKDPTAIFYEECRIWDGAHVHEEALLVNGYTEAEIKDGNKQTEEILYLRFIDWLTSRDDFVLAGHNPSFDLSFLRHAAERAHENYILSSRSLDLHTACFIHMEQSGIEPPLLHHKSNLNSDTVMTYVGIPKEPRPHIAINGALWEAEAFSRIMYDRGLLSQFEQYPIPWVE